MAQMVEHVIARAKETDQHDFSHARFSRGFNYVVRAFDVNALIRLIPAFTIDPGAMRNGVATGKCLRKFVRVAESDLEKLCIRQMPNCGIGLVISTRDQHDFVPIASQSPRNVSSNETGASGDGDFHFAPPPKAAHAYTIGR